MIEIAGFRDVGAAGEYSSCGCVDEGVVGLVWVGELHVYVCEKGES